MPRGQKKRKGLTHATLSLHLSFSLSFSSVHYLLQSKQVLVLLLHKQTYHGETFNIHVHFSAARMEMGSCITIHFIKAKSLLRSDTTRPTLNQSSSPQQTAATTPDTAPAMP